MKLGIDLDGRDFVHALLAPAAAAAESDFSPASPCTSTPCSTNHLATSI